MKEAIIVDIDGTLADVEHRVHHVRGDKKDWKSFNRSMGNDTLNLWCKKLIDAMKNKNYEVLLVTGRGEDYRDHTENWLKQNQVQYDHLWMRAAKDHRGDDIIKREIYFEKIKNQYDVLFVVDDRKSVVAMWRKLGLVCLQCDWGDF
ncbi:MAG: NIF family HAD-type phosphatase [Bdellovibrio sp.]